MSFDDFGRGAATVCAVALIAGMQQVNYAEDAGTFRPYLQLRSGAIEISGVQDAWGLAVGANLNSYLGFQLDFDAFERRVNWPDLGQIGEESLLTLTPEVRVRYPLWNGRLVPYFFGGPGVTFLQFNDRKEPVYHRDVNGDSTQFSAVAGVGLEYFVADNISFSLEGKYDWVSSARVNLDGERRSVNYSSGLIMLGVRAYFIENHHRTLLMESAPDYPNRFWGGFRYGSSVLVDKRLNKELHFEPVAAALGGSGNQAGSFLLGYNAGKHWGFGLAGNYAEYDLVSDKLGAIGEYSNFSVIPEARYHWTLWDGKLSPFVSAGVGISYSEFNDAKTASQGLHINANGIYPAANLGGGAEYFFARNLSVSAETHYATYWGHKIPINGVDLGSGSFSALNFYLGLRFYLTEH
jgi:opacity protein-like surface antigen